jgi:PAS domain S-box-containing protein
MDVLKALIEKSDKGFALVQNGVITEMNEIMAQSLMLNEKDIGSTLQEVGIILMHEAKYFLQKDTGRKGRFCLLEDNSYLLIHCEVCESRIINIVEKFDECPTNMILVCDLKGNMIESNSAWDRIIGSTEMEDLNTFLNRIHPEDVFNTQAALENLIKTGYISKFINRVKVADGHFGHFEWTGTLQGEYIYLMVGDISEQKVLAERIENSERNFREFFEALEEIVLIGDMEGNILNANSAAKRILGYPDEELIGKQIFDLHHEDDQEKNKEIFKAIMEGKRDNYRLDMMMASGERLPVDMKIILGNWNGEACIIGISRDLSFERELLEQYDQVFNVNPAAMAISNNISGKYIQVNEAFENLTGYTDEEAVGKKASELNLIKLPISPTSHSRNAYFINGRQYSLNKLTRKDGRVMTGLFSEVEMPGRNQDKKLAVMMDFSEQYAAEEELLKNNRMMEIIVSLATEFISMPAESIDEKINEMLETITFYAQADRGYVFKYDFDRGLINNTHEWCQIGVMPEIENLQNLDIALYQDWVDQHVNGDEIIIPDVTLMPEADMSKGALLEQGIQSLIALPISRGDTCYGFIGLDFVRQKRHYFRDDLKIIRVFNKVLASVCYRQELEKNVIKHETS